MITPLNLSARPMSYKRATIFDTFFDRNFILAPIIDWFDQLDTWILTHSSFSFLHELVCFPISFRAEGYLLTAPELRSSLRAICGD